MPTPTAHLCFAFCFAVSLIYFRSRVVAVKSLAVLGVPRGPFWNPLRSFAVFSITQKYNVCSLQYLLNYIQIYDIKSTYSVIPAMFVFHEKTQKLQVSK